MGETFRASNSLRIRSRLNHPVVDGDGHWVEALPVFFEYLSEVGGPAMVDYYMKIHRENPDAWYAATPNQRLTARMQRPPYWSNSNDALDRATSMIPQLMYERLDEMGIDFGILYPTIGIRASVDRDENYRLASSRAVNRMSADLFKPYGDRFTPAAVIPTTTPEEAIREAEYAVNVLGLKVGMMSGCILRPSRDASGDKREYVDYLAMDSLYEYDKLWAKLVELKLAASFHGGSQGWMDRRSPSNAVFNHAGHFAQASQVCAKAVFLSGVLKRFPSLTFVFLEGGMGWPMSLYQDILGHWKKRNRTAANRYLKPSSLDNHALRAFFENYATHPRFAGKIDDFFGRYADFTRPLKSLEELTARDLNADEFPGLGIESEQDVLSLYTSNFYFGCEADDRFVPLAFDPKMPRGFKPVFGSDISHWDVQDMSTVLEESWELVEDGLMDESAFRQFTFSNVVELHTRMNPNFFDGTVVEQALKKTGR